MYSIVRSTLKKWLPAPILRLIRFVRSCVIIPLIKKLKLMLHLPLKKARKKIRFEVHLAEHCNLNCCGCDHFSPLAEPAFIETNVFERDMKRLGYLFSHECEWIHLLGGEPLLNPEIITIMKITRDNFSSGSIQIVTNGILLSKMSEDFWRACHDNNVEVCMTNYPLKLDIDKIRAAADNFGVIFRYFGNNATKNIMYKAPLDLSGKGNARINFALCPRGNSCMFLKDGKLYTCTMIPNVHYFNEKFNQNIPVTEEDFIDIYQDIKPQEILRRLAQPVPACRYCDIKGISNNVIWHVSKREISEWV